MFIVVMILVSYSIFISLTCVSVSSFFFFKQKTAYEMRISDWSSDVCSSDLVFGADNIRAGSLGFLGLVATRKHADADGLAGALGQRHDAAHHLEIGRASCRERVCQYV